MRLGLSMEPGEKMHVEFLMKDKNILRQIAKVLVFCRSAYQHQTCDVSERGFQVCPVSWGSTRIKLSSFKVPATLARKTDSPFFEDPRLDRPRR